MFGIFKSFTKPFGRVAVNFGEPVILDKFLDQNWPDWRESRDKGMFSNVCVELGQTLAENINGAAALTPTNLLATSILSTPKRFQNAGWNVRSSLLQTLAQRASPSPHITVPDTPAREIVKHAVEVSQLNEHETPFGEIVQAEQTEAVLLTYYQNNSLHVFALASLLARLVRFSKLYAPTTVDYQLRGAAALHGSRAHVVMAQ